MKFALHFEMGNAAFDESPGDECRRILREVAEHARVHPDGNVRDVNGNTIGRWWIK